MMRHRLTACCPIQVVCSSTAAPRRLVCEAAPTRHGTGSLAQPPGQVCAWGTGRARTNANALGLASQDERPARVLQPTVPALVRAVRMGLLCGLQESLRGRRSTRSGKQGDAYSFWIVRCERQTIPGALGHRSSAAFCIKNARPAAHAAGVHRCLCCNNHLCTGTTPGDAAHQNARRRFKGRRRRPALRELLETESPARVSCGSASRPDRRESHLWK